MADYLLVQNKSIVHLGPIAWNPRYFQSEINDHVDSGDLTTTYRVPATEQGYVDLGDGFEFIPVASYVAPDHDSMFEHLAGPFWTYENNEAHASFNVQQKPSLDSAKGDLKGLAAQQRYNKEIAGTKTSVTSSNVEIEIYTDRDYRNQYLQLMASVQDTPDATFRFKSTAGFVEVGAADVMKMIEAVKTHVQTQYDWEHDITVQIDNATTVEELKDIRTIIMDYNKKPIDETTPGLARRLARQNAI